ncbi:MAG: SMP-30/gluconolactonase/LRE family protein [Pseudomonadota bacterium]|nr:SMP-30/gluconolactonase/LRE family protein [Pseudomonadota bacterium]
MASLDFRYIREELAKTQLGESPVWDPQASELWWVDVEGRRTLRADIVTGAVDAWEMPELTGFVALVGPGRPVVGMQTGIYAFDPVARSFDRIVAFEREGCRFNDATVDRAGRLWTSTMASDARTGLGAIHRVTPEATLLTVADGLTIPNGLAADLERGRLFHSDSHPDTRTVWVRPLDPATCALGAPATFANMHALAGRPDGAALDLEGNYWIAGVDGAQIYVFGLDGALHTVLPVPFPKPTKVSFSGPDGRLIAVTSKDDPSGGGYMALADLPAGMARGVPQPYWRPGAG